MHAHGINYRYLGYVRSYVSTQQNSLREILLEEIIARTYKNLLRAQMRRHHLTHNELFLKDKQVGILVWKTICSLYHMDEIGEYSYWNDTVLPGITNHFGEFLNLPGNMDIIGLKDKPKILLEKYTHLPRLARRLCKLLSVEIDIETWNHLENNEFEQPKLTSWERDLRGSVNLLFPAFNEWWKYLLNILDFNPNEFSMDRDSKEFEKRLKKSSADVFNLVHHLIRLCKSIVYEYSCHGAEFQQIVLFFLASTIDETAETFSTDPLYVPFEFEWSNSLNNLYLKENLNEMNLIQQQNHLSKLSKCKKLFSIYYFGLIRMEKPPDNLLKLLLSLVADNIKEKQHSEILLKGILFYCQQYINHQKNVEIFFQCYELLFLFLSNENDNNIIKFFYLISFLKELLDLKSVTSFMVPDLLMIRTYTQLFWLLLSIFPNSDTDGCYKRIQSSYFLAKWYLTEETPSPIFFMIERCESVLPLNNLLSDSELLSEGDFIDELLEIYIPKLLQHCGTDIRDTIDATLEILLK